MAVLLMVNSHRVVLKKQILPECRAMMEPYLHDIWQQFFEIFSDNSNLQREKFFREPLISYLWGKFVEQCGKEITEMMQKVGSTGQP